MPPVRRRIDTLTLEQAFRAGPQVYFKPVRSPVPEQKDAVMTVAVAMASGATINITTFLESPEYAMDRLQLQLVEGFVVAFILIAWLVAIMMFMHRWHKLRILPPADAMFKNRPKNIEKITVVKRPTDSVIYRNYSRRMSKTIIARQKHLARMNTMPELKVHLGPKDKKLDRLRTMPIIEMDDSGGLHMIPAGGSTPNTPKHSSSRSSCNSISEESQN